jgi:cytochrome c oxidase subunit 2
MLPLLTVLIRTVTLARAAALTVRPPAALPYAIDNRCTPTLPVQTAERTGEKLYLERGCIGCHFDAGGSPPVGPSLSALAGSKVVLDGAETVVATDGYLTQSIADPDAQVVQGFPKGLMSARVTPQHPTGAEIKALVAYIKTLKR